MGSSVLILALAGTSGFMAAFMAARAFLQAGRRTIARKISRGEEDVPADTFLAQLMRNGVPAFYRCARLLRRIGPVDAFVEGLTRWAEEAGMRTSANSLASLLLAALIVLGVLASLVAATPVAGIAVCALAIAALALRLQTWQQVQRDAICEGVPGVLSTMGECFLSGYSLVQTMEMVAGQAKGDLAVVFERCSDTLRMGGTTKEALSSLQDVEGASELAFVAVALDVQHQSGGSIVAILAATQEVVQDRVELRRSLQVQTAQARLSARVVCLMPFVLVAVLTFLNEGFLDTFFSSFAGMAMLAIAIVMEGAGIALIRKMLRVAQ